MLYRLKCFSLFLISFCCLLLSSCSQRKPNFASLHKIDAHLHIRYSGPEFLDQAVADNFKVISILVDHSDIAWQKQFLEQQQKIHPKHIEYITTFTMRGWDDPDWQERTIAHLKNELANGAIAVKVWKNIGMVFRDKDSNFVMIDNPQFDPIFDFIESQNKTLTAHIGEPRDCWLPLDQMQANSNREYYRDHPQYHMRLHPEYPSYEEQIQSYERMLEKHPNLRYVGCHLASIEWSMQELAKSLARFPNMAVDLAARIDDIQLQDREEVREFFIRYQDRILYGTDLSIREKDEPKAFAEHAHQTWLTDWTYFSTDSVMTVSGIEKAVRGLDLPTAVLEKIYRLNAQRWYPGI